MVTVRVVSANSDGNIRFSCSDMEFAGELMAIMAEAAAEPIAFTVTFDENIKEEKSRFVNPEGGKESV